MYHPTRGGARGGAAEFSWDKIKSSKDREFYLGNSVAAPTGRWQDGRDINWYNKDSSSSSTDERREELRKVKEAETAALYAKLGRAPPTDGGEVGERLASGSKGEGTRLGTGANMEVMEGKKRWGTGEEEVSEADRRLARKFARDEVRRRRAEAGEEVEAEKRSREDGDRRRHRRSKDNSDEEGRHRHREHRRRSDRYKDDERDDRRHHRHGHRRRSPSRSRSRSRSPETSDRHRRRGEKDDRRRLKHVSSKPEREDGRERSRHGSPSCRHRDRNDHSSEHRSQRD